MSARFIEFRPSQEQRDNLETLATYLGALPRNYTGFAMKTYYGERSPDGIGAEYNVTELGDSPVPGCGSCACAIGHGPAAGMPIDHGKDWSWSGYSERVFGTSERWGVGAFMFGMDNPDDPQAASRRIFTVLAETAA